MNNIFKMSSDELYDAYGIEVDEDGVVYDPVDDREFQSLAAWKLYADQQDQGSARFEKTGGGRYYDDEY
jgi:hypothetical protein